MIGIAALVFEDEAQAHTAFKQVCELAHDRRVHLETATMGVHKENGEFDMAEAEVWVDTGGSNWNRFWRRMLHHTDAHMHDDEFVAELGDQVNPGDAAVFVSYELRYRPETLTELKRLGGTLIMNELTQEQKDVMLADIHADELDAQNKAFKKKERGEMLDDAAEYGIQNIE